MKHFLPGLCLTLSILLTAFSPVSAKPLAFLLTSFDPRSESPALDPAFQRKRNESACRDWIVQAEGRFTEGLLDRLRDAGADPVQYLPEDAFYVRLSPNATGKFRDIDGIRWAGPLAPAFRVDPALIARFHAQAPDSLVTLRLMMLPGVSAAEMVPVIERGQFKRQHLFDDEFQRTIVIAVPLSELPRLADTDGVLWIQEEPVFRLMNDTITWVIQTNQQDNHSVWDHGLRGQGQIVGVMDTGLDYGNCLFRDEAVSSPGPTHRKVVAYRSYGGNLWDSCFLGHGTHVSGTAAGNDLTGEKSRYNGVAPDARVTFGDVQDDSNASCFGGALSFNGDLTLPMADTYSDGARLQNNSWGTETNSYDILAASIDGFAYSHADFLPVFANGNSGPGANTAGSPATGKNVLSVGAGQRAPNQLGVADFSSRGPTRDGRMKPNLIATGQRVTSAQNTPGNSITRACKTISNFFGFEMSGTSMASPAATGGGVLVRQYFADGYYPTGVPTAGHGFEPTAALIRATLINSTRAMNGDARPNNDEGWGLLVLEDALYFPGDADTLLAIDDKSGVAQGSSVLKNVTVNRQGPLYISLAWTDRAGSPGAAAALVNNLDLTVTGADGTKYLGNNFTGGWSAPGGGMLTTGDRVNTEECVFIQSAAPGTYTVDVKGVSIPQGAFGRQAYALVVRGGIGEVNPNDRNPFPAKQIHAVDTPGDAGGSITVDWTASEDDGGGENDVATYAVMRAGDFSGPFTALGTVPAGTLTFIDASTTDGTAYFYKVRTTDRGGHTADSPVAGPVTSVSQVESGVSVKLAGYLETLLFAQGGNLVLLALPGSGTTGLSLLFEGQPTGLILHDDGFNGDPVAGDGVVQWTVPIPSGMTSGKLLLGLEPQGSGTSGGAWPYLVVR